MDADGTKRLPDGVWVYVLAALVGAVAGWRLCDLMPHAVTAAAALTGHIPYPADSLQHRIHAGGFSAIETLVAGALRLGLAPSDAARLVYAVQGGLYGSAAALTIHALSRRTVAALAGSAFFLLFLPYAGGIAYSDYIVAVFAPPTHGIVGLGLILTLGATVAAGWGAASVIVLILAVLAHPIMGLFDGALWAVLWGTRLWLTREDAAPRLRRAAWLGIAALPVLGLLVWKGVTAGGGGDPHLTGLFYELWDYHRSTRIDGVLALMLAQVGGLAVLAGVWVRSGGLTDSEELFAFHLILAAGSGIALYLGFHALRDSLPQAVLMAMPNRFINIPLVASFPVLAGLLLRRRNDALMLLPLAVLLAAPVAGEFSGIVEFQPAAALFVGLTLAVRRPRDPAPVQAEERFGPWRRRGVAAALTLAGVGTLLILPARSLMSEQPSARTVADRLDAVGGPILFADIRTLEMVTALSPRTPVLLNIGELDFIPYQPQEIPQVAAILGELYNVDFADPPSATRHRGGLILDDAPLDMGGRTATRTHWEGLPRDRWGDLARRHGFAAVAAPSRWTLDLPGVFTIWTDPDRGVRIWRIPD